MSDLAIRGVIATLHSRTAEAVYSYSPQSQPQPQRPGAPAQDAGDTPPLSVEEAVEQVGRHLGATQASLQFRVDKEAGRVVVTIVDAESGAVLRQLPSEEILRIARDLRGLLDEVA